MTKISIDLDRPNTSTSSMKTMPTKITPTSKYVNVLPQGRWPKIWAGSWAGSVSLRELSELLNREKAPSPGMVLPRERKEPLSREKVGFFENVGLL
jgi:hypothetical protein